MANVDVLDEKGNKTGEAKSMNEIHARGLWHRAVHVWFVNSKNELLLQLRAKDKINYPNMWDISAAGHVDSGEEPEESALREIKEEIGLDLSREKLEKIGEIKQQSVINNNTYFDNEFNDVYLVRMDLDLDHLKLQPDEVAKLRYVSISELKEWTSKGNLVVPHQQEHELLFKVLENS